MAKSLQPVALALLAAFRTQADAAGIWCREHITYVGTNGSNSYFGTDTSCALNYIINTSWSDSAQSRAISILLNAMNTKITANIF